MDATKESARIALTLIQQLTAISELRPQSEQTSLLTLHKFAYACLARLPTRAALAADKARRKEKRAAAAAKTKSRPCANCGGTFPACGCRPSEYAMAAADDNLAQERKA